MIRIAEPENDGVSTWDPYRRRLLLVGVLVGVLGGGGAAPSAAEGYKEGVPSLTDRLNGTTLKVARYRRPTFLGNLAALERRLAMVSGIVHAQQYANRLWAIADDSPGYLYPVEYGDTSDDTRVLAAIPVMGAEMYDWEALAAFELDGTKYLMIGDVGGNRPDDKKRKIGEKQVGKLYVVKEPRDADESVNVEWTISFALPWSDSHTNDVEAVAVDSKRKEILVLKKRKRLNEQRLLVLDLVKPAQGEALPVNAGTAWVTASIPDPEPWELVERKRDRTQTNWRGQPTALDVSRDGRTAVVLTLRNAYLFERRENETWPAAFGRPPRQIQLPFWLNGKHPTDADEEVLMRQREAICFGATTGTVFVASEQQNGELAQLLRLEVLAAE